MLPTRVEHGRLIPRTAEMRQQFVVEERDRLHLEIALRVVGARPQHPRRIPERDPEEAQRARERRRAAPVHPGHAHRSGTGRLDHGHAGLGVLSSAAAAAIATRKDRPSDPRAARLSAAPATRGTTGGSTRPRPGRSPGAGAFERRRQAATTGLRDTRASSRHRPSATRRYPAGRPNQTPPVGQARP